MNYLINKQKGIVEHISAAEDHVGGDCQHQQEDTNIGRIFFITTPGPLRETRMGLKKSS